MQGRAEEGMGWEGAWLNRGTAIIYHYYYVEIDSIKFWQFHSMTKSAHPTSTATQLTKVRAHSSRRLATQYPAKSKKFVLSIGCSFALAARIQHYANYVKLLVSRKMDSNWRPRCDRQHMKASDSGKSLQIGRRWFAKQLTPRLSRCPSVGTNCFHRNTNSRYMVQAEILEKDG